MRSHVSKLFRFIPCVLKSLAFINHGGLFQDSSNLALEDLEVFQDIATDYKERETHAHCKEDPKKV